MVETNNKEGDDLSFKPIRLNKVTTVSHLYIFFHLSYKTNEILQLLVKIFI